MIDLILELIPVETCGICAWPKAVYACEHSKGYTIWGPLQCAMGIQSHCRIRLKIIKVFHLFIFTSVILNPEKPEEYHRNKGDTCGVTSQVGETNNSRAAHIRRCLGHENVP